MGQEKDRRYNDSYLYRLNQELSGEKTITPYFTEVGLADQAVDMGEIREGELKGSADQEQTLS